MDVGTGVVYHLWRGDAWMYVLMLCALFGRVVRGYGCCIVISTYQHAHAYALLQKVRCYQHAHAYASPQEMRCCEKKMT